MASAPDYPHLKCSEDSGVRVFAVTSAQLLSTVAQKLDHDFAQAYDAPGPKHVVVNLEQVNYLSSAGVTSLVLLRKRVLAAGGQIIFCGVTPPVATVLRLCQLIELEGSGKPAVFVIEPDVATAVRRLAGLP